MKNRCKTRVHELYNAGLSDSEIRKKITVEFKIGLSIEIIQKIYKDNSFISEDNYEFDQDQLRKNIAKELHDSNKPLTISEIHHLIDKKPDCKTNRSTISTILHDELSDVVIFSEIDLTYSYKNHLSYYPKLNDSEEAAIKNLKTYYNKLEQVDLFEEIKNTFKSKLINVSSGDDRIDFIITSIVKDNKITKNEEIFLISKSKEYGFKNDIINIAKKSLANNNPYLDNLINIILADGQITFEETNFLIEKTNENELNESFVNERFWTIGLSSYLHHLIKNKHLNDLLKIAYFYYFYTEKNKDNLSIFLNRLNIFKEKDILLNAKNQLELLKQELNSYLCNTLTINYNYSDYLLNEIQLTSTLGDSPNNPNKINTFEVSTFMKLLNQERIRIGSPDVNLLVENVKYRIENELWD